MKDKIKELKNAVLGGIEKELYKTSVPVTVKYTVGDGGEYTKEEADVMAHFYNNGNIDLNWLLDNIKNTYGLQSLRDKGVLYNFNTEGKYATCSVSKEAIKETVIKPINIVKRKEASGLSIEEMNELDELIGNAR